MAGRIKRLTNSNVLLCSPVHGCRRHDTFNRISAKKNLRRSCAKTASNVTRPMMMRELKSLWNVFRAFKAIICVFLLAMFITWIFFRWDPAVFLMSHHKPSSTLSLRLSSLSLIDPSCWKRTKQKLCFSPNSSAFSRWQNIFHFITPVPSLFPRIEWSLESFSFHSVKNALQLVVITPILYIYFHSFLLFSLLLPPTSSSPLLNLKQVELCALRVQKKQEQQIEKSLNRAENPPA